MIVIIVFCVIIVLNNIERGGVLFCFLCVWFIEFIVIISFKVS